MRAELVERPLHFLVGRGFEPWPSQTNDKMLYLLLPILAFGIARIGHGAVECGKSVFCD